jgi:hypothetical protein
MLLVWRDARCSAATSNRRERTTDSNIFIYAQNHFDFESPLVTSMPSVKKDKTPLQVFEVALGEMRGKSFFSDVKLDATWKVMREPRLELS